MFVEIKNKENLIRELGSKALLNTNSDEINRYHQQRKLLEKNRNISEKMETLENRMDKIEDLLEKILDRIK